MATAPSRASQPGAGRTFAVVACEVRRWRGYVTSEFYARRVDDGSVVATSGMFRWSKKAPPPDRGGARAAFDHLKVELVAQGWRDAGTNAGWFEHRFERHEAVPAQTIVQPVFLEPQVPVAVEPPFVERQAVSGDSTQREEEQGSSGGRQIPGAAAEAAVPDAEAPSETFVRPRRRRKIAAITGALVLTIGSVGGWFVLEHGRSGHSAELGGTAAVAGSHAPATSAARLPAATPTSAVGSPAGPVEARLRVVGRRHGSWLEVRLRSAGGRVLYSGIVRAGEHKLFRARRLWVTFGGATNLLITVNGVRENLQGTVEALVTPRGIAAP